MPELPIFYLITNKLFLYKGNYHGENTYHHAHFRSCRKRRCPYSRKIGKSGSCKVNIYLFGNAVNLSKTETPITGDLHINQTLIDHIEKNKVIKKLIELSELGANISTCHTNEHARGIEAYPYAGNIQWGDIGGTFTKFLMTSDVFLTIGH